MVGPDESGPVVGSSKSGVVGLAGFPEDVTVVALGGGSGSEGCTEVLGGGVRDGGMTWVCRLGNDRVANERETETYQSYKVVAYHS